MRASAKRLAAALTACALIGAVPQSAAAQDGGLTGWMHLGYRFLSLDGGTYSEWKYNEDHDYQGGVRLLGLALQGSLGPQDYSVSASGWGLEADPVATLGGWLRRPGVYKLSFGGYNARYYHSTGSYVEDYGLSGIPFSFTRRGRYADLALTLGALPKFHIRYDTFRRQGYNNQVWNIEREKHAALTPVDETTNSVSVYTSIPIMTSSLDLSYTVYSLDNTYGAVTADTSYGLDGGTGTLYAYNRLVTDEGSLPVAKANFTVPFGTATLRASYANSWGTIDKTLRDVESGIRYNGSPLNTNATQTGAIERSFDIIDVGATLPMPFDLTGDVSMRRTDYSIAGSWDPTGLDEEVDTEVSSVRYQGKVIWRPVRGVTADFGGAYVSRTFHHPEHTLPRGDETVTTDFIGGVTFTRMEGLTLRVSHRVADIENPYTRLSPTDLNSTRYTVTCEPLEWLDLSAGYQTGVAYRYYTQDETNPGFAYNARTSDVRNLTIGLTTDGFPYLEGLDGHLHYSRGRFGASIPIALAGPPFPPVFDYFDVNYTILGGLQYALAEDLRIEADGTWHRSKGQWPLYRLQRRLGVAKDLAGFTLLADLRLVSLNLVASDLDDYDAMFVTIGLRRAF